VRGKVIAAVGRLVEDNKQALAELVTREVGKPMAEALGEVQEIIDTCDFFLGEGRRLYGQTVPSEMRDKQLFTFRMPVGVAGIITAGNFPVAVPSWYLVPALLCGNAVVWKPADYAAALGDALTRLFVAGGVPAGVLNTVQADGPTTFEGLSQALEQGLVNKVGLHRLVRGRRPHRRAVRQAPAEPVPGARRQEPARRDAGRRPRPRRRGCALLRLRHGRSALHLARRRDPARRRARRVPRQAARAAGRRAGGRPDAGRAVRPDAVRALPARLGEVARRGAAAPHRARQHRPITSDNPREGFVGDPDAGVFAHPVVVSGVRPDDALYRNETFGPLVSVMRFSTFDEAVELANGHGYGLSAAIYTRDAQSAFRFRERVSAGMLSVNNSTSGAEAHLPFGGNGKSGNGSRQSGVWVLDQFTRWQSMNWDYAGKLQKAQMDTEESASGAVADPRFRLQQTP
jgi:aldehyde dehydrogenase (NAD+)